MNEKDGRLNPDGQTGENACMQWNCLQLSCKGRLKRQGLVALSAVSSEPDVFSIINAREECHIQSIQIY